MEWPKVKNIILIILALVNGFLLVLVLGQRRAVEEYARSAVTRAVEVLDRSGITVSEASLGEAESPPARLTGRDLAAEARAAQALLGEDVIREDRSGGLYVYESAAGTALFRSSGGFSAQLTDCPLDGGDPGQHALALLSAMGLSGEVAQTPAGDGTVLIRQTVAGLPVYSCTLTFYYRGGCLREIHGALLAGEFQPAEGDAPLDLPNTLIRFLDGILQRGDVCSAITGLRPGYRLTQSFGAELRLTPVWLVTTNVGSYYVDGLDGAVEPVQSLSS